jgi:hypothetical protein
MNDVKIDTYGCPEYFIDASAIEVMGANIRLSFGIHRGDQIQGVFSMVMTAEFAVACSKVCQQVSLEAAFRALGGSDARVIAH